MKRLTEPSRDSLCDLSRGHRKSRESRGISKLVSVQWCETSGSAGRRPARSRVGGGPRGRRAARYGHRIVHGDKELLEKLGRNDPCPCGSGRRFQEVLHALRAI